MTYYPWEKLLDPTAKTDSILKIDPFLYQNQSYYYYINYYINLTKKITYNTLFVQLTMYNYYPWLILSSDVA